MTPAEFKTARRALGLSVNSMAQVVGVATGRTIRKWEAGDRSIPGPAILAMWFLLTEAGIKPRFARAFSPSPGGCEGGTTGARPS